MEIFRTIFVRDQRYGNAQLFTVKVERQMREMN